VGCGVYVVGCGEWGVGCRAVPPLKASMSRLGFEDSGFEDSGFEDSGFEDSGFMWGSGFGG